MLVDGTQIAEDIIGSLSSDRPLVLGIVVGDNTPATESFVRIKERVAQRLGVEVVRYEPKDIGTAIVKSDGVVVQLPIANAAELRAALPKEKDIDTYPQAPVAAAVEEIFKRYGVDAKNKKAVVVGEGILVGKPVAVLLEQLGAVVTTVSLEKGALTDLKDADIVVSGAGSPGLIKPEMLRNGVVLIDAGTSESMGKVVGDCDPTCADVASVFTSVPGGVGPIAVAMLFKNLYGQSRGTHVAP